MNFCFWMFLNGISKFSEKLKNWGFFCLYVYKNVEKVLFK